MEDRARIPVSPPVSNPLPSYWQTPKSPLANVIEPAPERSQPPTYDYCIIGSGITGTSIAYNVLRHKPSPRIILLEAREACSGATGRNGGHTKAASYRTYLQHKAELGKEEALSIARMEYQNILATHRMAAELGIECESKMCNTVDLVYDSETFEVGKAAIGELRADATEEERKEGGMAWYKIYSAEEAATRFHAASENTNPAVEEKEELVGAFEYLAGRINAYKFTTGLLKECVKKGLDICTNTVVRKIDRTTGALGPTTSNIVVTDHSRILAHTVIVATNGYTPYLLPQLQGTIVPLRGQITAQKPGRNTLLPSPLPTTYSFIYRTGYEYMIPRPLPSSSGGGQHIIIGGGLGRQSNQGLSEYGIVDDASLNPDISRYLNGVLAGYFGVHNWGESRGDADQRIMQEWTGIMGATADGRPFVGRVPGMEDVWVAAGFNGHGMVLCLKTAEALVQMLHGVSPEEMDWYPRSFIISEERVGRCHFHGRKDMIGEDEESESTIA
ncbi:FAD dependent oxidoreductase-like protein [Westerdykella ornata]|uniref:FAD dependent oxidoreductase-like protein n=1 Tax=Westerdykella ornata TaxID=318751 RepID=A0A6A6JNR6_WESOR|nr:FAD dependent oxidoreductase-like protein [Westerdykella ornata]KAF2277316.1 FAD dependent oxidoreductase-like protein [Westerdykella ornata]